MTGRIFINDVGETRWEEINEGFPGANYGWPRAEGPSTDPRFRPPIHSYPVASVSGGAFCPIGPAVNFPPQYRGRYFFADFVKGWVKVLDPDHPEHIETFATGFARPVDLKFGTDGSLYVLVRDALGQGPQLPPRNRVASDDLCTADNEPATYSFHANSPDSTPQSLPKYPAAMKAEWPSLKLLASTSRQSG